jgi:hypothetical protein
MTWMSNRFAQCFHIELAESLSRNWYTKIAPKAKRWVASKPQVGNLSMLV